MARNAMEIRGITSIFHARDLVRGKGDRHLFEGG
jgi:hypothetical protein